MALAVLVLKRKLDMKKGNLAELRGKDAELVTREAELEAAVEEMTEETSEEDQKTVEEAVDAFDAEKTAHETAKSDLEQEIADIEAAILEEEKKQVPKAGEPTPPEDKRGANMKMNTRKFFGMNMQERDAFFANDEVKGFLERVKQLGMEKRAVTGADLTIPEVMLDLLKENITENSKLLKYVNAKPVKGKARKTIMGTIPEAIWIEMRALLNELTFDFKQAEVDGYKVGGYVPINTEDLQDSDISLASEIILGMGRAIGLAIDKAILYGTGTKMPLGIVPRLVQTTKPTTYSSDMPTWVNLSTTNITSITAANSTGTTLFQKILTAAGAAKSDYATGEKFFAMNETTYTTLLAESLNAYSGKLSVGLSEKKMPGGGNIETLSFLPNNVIIGGYGELYLLAEREGTTLSKSEHVKFIEDQVVYKGVARYDGLPVIAEGFVAIGLSATAISGTAVTFATDTANAVAES